MIRSIRNIGIFGFILIFCSNSYAQKSNLDYGKISSLILKRVNAYRDSIDARLLKNNAILAEAAKDQSDYMNWHNYLGHDQITYNKQTPAERVFYYGGNFNYIGENVAFITPRINDSTFKSSQVLADEFFTVWINSPPHRENISNDLYYQSGIAFAYDQERNKLYSAEVFSALGYHFQERFKSPAKAYNVQAYNKTTCEDMKNFRYGALTMANHLFVRNDSIFIRYHDLNYFKQIISDPNDGYAIDIVFRDQLPCNSPNLFHGSTIFDGYMLEPKFQYDLYKTNYSGNPKKLIAYLGKLPKGIPSYELNMILIKDNVMCDYSYPVVVPSDDIRPFYIEPMLIDTLPLQRTGIHVDTIVELHFSFNRSSTKWNEKESYQPLLGLYPYGNFINKVEINTFSSVEGKEWYNIRLQEARAKKIEEMIRAVILGSTADIEINSKENWGVFNEQIKANQLSEFDGKSREEVKRILKLKTGNPLYDSLLFDQRTSNARIYIKGDISPDSDGPETALLWKEAQEKYNFEWSTHLLYSALTNGTDYRYTRFVQNNDTFYTYIPFACNILAAQIKRNNDKFPDLLENTTLFELPLNHKAHVYAFTNWANIYYHNLHWRSDYYWDDLSEIKPMIEPERVFDKLNTIEPTYFEDTTYLPRLKLNHLLASINYFTYSNQWPKVHSYFDQIYHYFYASNLPVDKATDLALFCNHYYKFNKAVAILDHYFDLQKLDENGAFVLAQTATLIQKELDPKRYSEYMEFARTLYPTRWCSWLNSNFQVLRNETVKGMYCTYCN